MKDRIDSPVALALIVAIGLVVSDFQAPAVAAELDCGKLAGRLKSGDDYKLMLDLQSQKVRIELGDDYCAEPAKAWFGRQLILPPPAQRNMALPSAALEAPRSEVTVTRKPDRGNDTIALPGQKMRQGALPDLGFNSIEREVMPLPIQRASDVPKVEEPKNAAAAETPEQPGTAPVAEMVEQPGMAPAPDQPVDAATGVRISNDPEGGAAKVTKYKADYQNSGLPTPTIDGAVPSATTLASPDGAPSAATLASPDGAAPKSADKAATKAEPKPVHTCDRELTDFWKAGTHKINDQMTNLIGVFTVDLDNDGRVDNVGFKIGATGRIGNVLGYFPVGNGRLAARKISTLKLDNDDDIHRLCPGDVTFATMTLQDKQKAVGSAIRRSTDVAAATKPARKSAKAEKETANAENVKEETPEQSAKEKTDNLLTWAIGIATVFFLFGGVGLFLAIRNMRSNEDDEEEGDEDEDEDE